MSIEEELRTLIERNYVKLLHQLATVTRLLDARDQGGSLGHGSIIEAQGLTHQMKGAAGTIGFGAMGAAAAALDESLRRLLTRDRSIPAEQLKHPLALLSALQRAAGETAPEHSTLYKADLSQFAR
jgi:HPt (histidine-containing phosphotransfer) domain-containing protein